MNYEAIRPEDLMSDKESFFEKDGQTIRKGTMAATLANMDIVDSDQASSAQKKEALKVLKELAPKLIAIGLNKHFYCRNPDVQAIFDADQK